MRIDKVICDVCRKEIIPFGKNNDIFKLKLEDETEVRGRFFCYKLIQIPVDICFLCVRDHAVKIAS